MTLLALATRNLMRNRRRTAISLAALVVGVGAMVVLRGLVNGQQRIILENIVYGQLGAVQVHRAGYLAHVQGSPLSLDMEDSEALRRQLTSVPGVHGVSPRLAFGGMLSMPEPQGVEEGEPRTAFLQLLAFDPALEPRVTPKRMTWLGQGAFLSKVDAPELMLNADLARGLGTGVMDAKAPPPEEQWPALLAADRDGALNGEGLRISGMLVSATPGDRRVGYLPLATAQRVLRMEGRVTEYALAVEPLEHARRVRDALRASLGPGYEVHTWEEVFPFIAQILGQQDFLFGILSTVFLAAVLLGIVNVMLMNVLERVREIGTMMAVGMRRRSIILLFLLEGGVLGLVGGAVGALVGGAVTLWLHERGILLPSPGANVDSIIRPSVSFLYLMYVVGLATVGASLAALWPAWRASRLRPVEALASV
ncbi:ABC transporter permease [Hyalangium rubrum]|uniref:FtsX-like permease family protein n=1 Tax=Hyalangium rubrum TaxID=3103134 RepID=A0ABU5H1W7_9BACT|nr:FtsX-like permease family protein [Hyalangium sp. s54d21]MDY7226782.1 FtsX-like permease family protein [Hyalangium sp. s54d21]